MLGDEVQSRIRDAGFTINDAKTRMQVRGSRQTVTGLTVNEKVNNHIHHIRERQIDLTIDAEENKERRYKLRTDRTTLKNKYPSAIRLVYFRLVFFKHFIDPGKPLIICEGPTDSVYLRCAIRKLATAHPKLASVKDGKLFLNVNFFKYSKQSKDLLQLRGGSSDLKFFLETWKNMLAKFKHRPMKHPVIVSIDNDDGATEIFKLLQSKKFGITISHATDLSFYHLDGPLYLVKTPIKGTDNKSCIENFFDPALLERKVDSKTFNFHKEHEAPGEFTQSQPQRTLCPDAGTLPKEVNI